MKFYAQGKFRVLLGGPAEYMSDVMAALEGGACNVFAQIDWNKLREKLTQKGVPEEFIKEHIKNMSLDDDTWASTRASW